VLATIFSVANSHQFVYPAPFRSVQQQMHCTSHFVHYVVMNELCIVMTFSIVCIFLMLTTVCYDQSTEWITCKWTYMHSFVCASRFISAVVIFPDAVRLS